MEFETYTMVKSSIKQLLNINLEHYKDQQMRRRLDSWLVRSGAPDWPRYFQQVRKDPNELVKFRNYLTINVSAFFRDPERWRSLQDKILPGLLDALPRRRPAGQGLQIWSAGCSIGAEAYTLSIILDEIAPRQFHHILATDLDKGALEKARNQGPYTADEVKNLNRSQKAAYIQPGGPPFYVKPHLAKKITFQENNLFKDSAPANMDLIICRNVVIYFTNEAKDQLYRKFHRALRPGGVLFVGATEIIPRPREIGFQSQGTSFYVKT